MEKWQHSDVVDAVLAPASIGLIVAYHVYLFYNVRTQPLRTLIGINQKARRLWVREMLSEHHQRKNVLAVQTIRNSIMESTLMATTAVLLTAAMATYFTFASSIKPFPGGGGIKPSTSSSTLSPLSSYSPGSVSNTIKTFSVLSCLMLSFLCHTQSIRFLNHVNYMINVPMDSRICLTTDYLGDLMERGTFIYSVGSRTFYVSFPLLLWVFGSVPMFLCALVLLHAFYTSDFVYYNIPGDAEVDNPLSDKILHEDLEQQHQKPHVHGRPE
ncbi:hypothetical protein KP509_27G044500 [Ceratopteris richardii]|uniref:Uncharacterized protein n=1 Tax=Ceratopteris richardii TaxID=49495 RepID=A0A8T2RHU2_CERRI|nr:hypothetical protein KP509_27G044500 [Ceratopteris richardii]KAH7295391.1 hypothetical protein KP509_27G044500 [Ceratopteris richardii]KAH7295392.1 hypothetical protein KP509_27G044500 [Ceratopteris richardii]KAH7295393.1 hypothetical protein KP509_27G044500 [Ceratopteris richardii]KAH7295394.1 hypothetical protein KP509_27G044500 [Ceratopteris richardii]